MGNHELSMLCDAQQRRHISTSTDSACFPLKNSEDAASQLAQPARQDAVDKQLQVIVTNCTHKKRRNRHHNVRQELQSKHRETKGISPNGQTRAKNTAIMRMGASALMSESAAIVWEPPAIVWEPSRGDAGQKVDQCPRRQLALHRGRLLAQHCAPLCSWQRRRGYRRAAKALPQERRLHRRRLLLPAPRGPAHCRCSCTTTLSTAGTVKVGHFPHTGRHTRPESGHTGG